MAQISLNTDEKNAILLKTSLEFVTRWILYKGIGKAVRKKLKSLSIEDNLRDHGLDSLEAIELVMQVEEHFDVEISDEVAEKMETISAIINYLYEKINAEQIISVCEEELKKEENDEEEKTEKKELVEYFISTLRKQIIDIEDEYIQTILTQHKITLL